MARAYQEQETRLADRMCALRTADELLFKAAGYNDVEDDVRNDALFALRQLKELIERFEKDYHAGFDKLKTMKTTAS